MYIYIYIYIFIAIRCTNEMGALSAMIVRPDGRNPRRCVTHVEFILYE